MAGVTPRAPARQAFCCYGATKLKVDDTDEAFIPDGSYLIDTNNARDK